MYVVVNPNFVAYKFALVERLSTIFVVKEVSQKNRGILGFGT
jgi:hypothetical protein